MSDFFLFSIFYQSPDRAPARHRFTIPGPLGYIAWALLLRNLHPGFVIHVLTYFTHFNIHFFTDSLAFAKRSRSSKPGFFRFSFCGYNFHCILDAFFPLCLGRNAQGHNWSPSAQNLPRSIDRQLIVRGLVMNVNAVGSRDLIGFRFLFIDMRPLFFFSMNLFPS